jgi:hypothetical protein
MRRRVCAQLGETQLSLDLYPVNSDEPTPSRAPEMGDRVPAQSQASMQADAVTVKDEPICEQTPDPAPVTVLADALAPRLAEELSHRIPSRASEPSSTARLLTLDELVAELPPAKRPQTWKRWLYERTRRGEIPGCVKLGGMLFFEREPALAWLRAGATATR